MRALLITGVLVTFAASSARADSGRYRPGDVGLRETLLPERALHLGLRYAYHRSIEFLDDRGRKFDEVTITLPRLGEVTVPLGVDLDRSYATLALTAVPFEQDLGGDLRLRLGLVLAPELTNSQWTRGVFSPLLGNTSVMGLGDLLVQPLILGLEAQRWSCSASYGFYAPTGAYDPDEAVNPGRGFWTHMLQLTLAARVDPNAMGGPVLRASYETSHAGSERSAIPGQGVTLELGWSHDLVEYQGLALGATATGGVQAELTASQDKRPLRGRLGGIVASRRDPRADGRSQLLWLGGELNVSYLPWGLRVDALFSYELEAQNRPRGFHFGINLRFALPPLRKPRYGPP